MPVREWGAGGASENEGPGKWIRSERKVVVCADDDGGAAGAGSWLVVVTVVVVVEANEQAGRASRLDDAW